MNVVQKIIAFLTDNEGAVTRVKQFAIDVAFRYSAFSHLVFNIETQSALQLVIQILVPCHNFLHLLIHC